MIHRYNEYKDSKIDWLGEIPADWELKRMRFIAAVKNSNVDKKSYDDQPEVRLCNYTDIYYNEFITDEMEFMKATASEEEIESVGLLEGDVIITKDSEDPRDIGIPSIVTEKLTNVVCGYHLTILRSKSKDIGRYIHRYMQSVPIKHYLLINTPGVTRYGLDQETIKDIPIPLPTQSECKKICDFLDVETGRIDNLISAKKNFLSLLKEKRQSLISHIVNKGLDSKVKMKESGCPWIGQVPAHWTVLKLKRIASMVGGFAFKSDDFEESGVQLIRIGNVYQNRLSLERQPVFLPDHYLETYKNFVVKNGDILMSLTGTLGKKDYGYAVKVESDREFLLNQRVGKIVFDNKKIISDYAIHLLHSESYLNQLYSLPFGTKQANLSNDDVIAATVAIPPTLDEQRLIIETLSLELSKIDSLESDVLKTIILLKEHRSALVTAAVTGKLKC